MGMTISRAFGTRSSCASQPNAEALGYFHVSLRDRPSQRGS